MKKSFLTGIALVIALIAGAQTPAEIPSGLEVLIQSAMNYGKNKGGHWDIPGKPQDIKKGSNIQVWNIDDGHDRLFTIMASGKPGYYEIQVGNTQRARVNIDGGKSANGTNVEVWDRDGNTKQLFKFHHLGNGRFKIYDHNNKILCLAGKKNANGTNVHIWNDHNGPFTEWYIINERTGKPFVPGSKVDIKSWIVSQKQSDIDRYFPDVMFGQVKIDDKGAISNGISSLSAEDQVSTVVWVMNAVRKNSDENVRKYVYTELSKVQYRKIPFIVKAIMTTHFSNFNESTPVLMDNVSAIQIKMNSAK